MGLIDYDIDKSIHISYGGNIMAMRFGTKGKRSFRFEIDGVDLNWNEKVVYEYLKKRRNSWISLKDINVRFGRDGSSTGWASNICKSLVNFGVAEKSPKGWYRAKGRRKK